MILLVYRKFLEFKVHLNAQTMAVNMLTHVFLSLICICFIGSFIYCKDFFFFCELVSFSAC